MNTPELATVTLWIDNKAITVTVDCLEGEVKQALDENGDEVKLSEEEATDAIQWAREGMDETGR